MLYKLVLVFRCVAPFRNRQSSGRC